jgi:hypothetical protein
MTEWLDIGMCDHRIDSERQWIKFARYTDLDNCIGKAQQTVRRYQSPNGMVIEMKLTMDGIEYRGRLVQVKGDEEE